MAEKDIFAEREHWLEEEYFRRHNQELIEKMHQHAALEADRQQLAEITGLKDDEALSGLQELGFTAETVGLLHLVPLVEVAWAEGGVADRERALIFKIARARGIAPGSPADQMLTEWLNVRPTERFFAATLHATRLLLEALPPEQREASRDSLIAYCNQIASVMAGGILGRGQISEEEQQLIAHIAAELGWHRHA